MESGLTPMHPGEFLREEILPNLEMSKTALAARLRISRQTLFDVLGERQPVTPNLAIRLGRLLGNSPQFWLNMQASYDLAVLSREMGAEIAQIEPLNAA